MSCKPCTLVGALSLNVLLWLDLTLNTCLAGNPRETVSRRTARARAAGSKPAAFFCRVLTKISNVLGRHGDHCDWAISDQPTVASEIWHWSQPDTSDLGNG